MVTWLLAIILNRVVSLSMIYTFLSVSSIIYMYIYIYIISAHLGAIVKISLHGDIATRNYFEQSCFAFNDLHVPVCILYIYIDMYICACMKR